jgi:DNA-binding IclR family transcriptional regulator
MSDESRSELPAPLRAFLHSCIESIDQIEMLMILRGTEEGRPVRDIAVALRMEPSNARRDLDTLAARGLLKVIVAEETSYRYRPKSSELAQYCDLLAQYYVASRQTVFGYVAAESRRSIKRFADAFKLRDPET